MTEQEAQEVLDSLKGWANPHIQDVGYGDYIVLATDPETGRELEYNPGTGFFN